MEVGKGKRSSQDVICKVRKFGKDHLNNRNYPILKHPYKALKGTYLYKLPYEILDIIFKKVSILGLQELFNKDPELNYKHFCNFSCHSCYKTGLNYKTITHNTNGLTKYKRNNYDDWRETDYYRSINIENQSQTMEKNQYQYENGNNPKWLSEKIQLEDKTADVISIIINDNLDCIFKTLIKYLESYLSVFGVAGDILDITDVGYNEDFYTEIIKNLDINTLLELFHLYFHMDPMAINDEDFFNDNNFPLYYETPGFSILYENTAMGIEGVDVVKEGLRKIKQVYSEAKDKGTNTFTILEGFHSDKIGLGDNQRLTLESFGGMNYDDKLDDIWISKNNEKRLNYWDISLTGYYAEVIGGQIIQEHLWSNRVKTLYMEAKSAKKTFKKLLKMMEIDRKVKAIMLDRYVYQGLPPVVFNIWDMYIVHKDIRVVLGSKAFNNLFKKRKCFNSGTGNFFTSYNNPNVVFLSQIRTYNYTPDKNRIYDFRRLKMLESKFIDNPERIFYLLKSGMCYYKHTDTNYKRVYRDLYKAFYDDNLKTAYDKHDDLGSLDEYLKYLSSVSSYHNSNGNKRGYDLRHNLYKSTYHSNNPIDEFEYNEITTEYNRYNWLEKKQIKKATGEYPKTYYSGHLDPDKFITDWNYIDG